MADEPTALNLATFEELWEELRSRCTCTLLVYERQEKKPDELGVGCWWSGGKIACTGLATYARHKLIDSFKTDPEALDSDD